MLPIVLGTGALFAALGAAAERLASVWPEAEARRRPPGLRTVGLAVAAALSGATLVARSSLEPWATAFYLVALALLILLAATDIEQRRLPHLLLDPLIVLAVVFVPINPAVEWQWAVIGAVAAVAFLGVVGLVIRGGLAVGDLYLVAPMGLLLGWPTIFTALFAAAFGAAAWSIALLATRRAAMGSYIPFGPFLVGGAILALLTDPRLLGLAAR